MDNPAIRLEMGRTARREVEEKYSRKKVEQQLIEEVEKLESVKVKM